MKIFKGPDIKPRNFHGLISVCPKMFEFFELIKKVARTESSILVRGETGTGKELTASAIHNLSPRKNGPFNAINCATLTPDLIVSELFGHERGAFTGAINSRIGLFQASNGGTIFLDEVAEIPLQIQARLLRALEERVVTPLGATKAIKVDTRVISATHRALRTESAAGRFREDLMYRLRVIPIFLPRLADRIGDVEALTWIFIKEFNKLGFRKVEGIEQPAMKAMCEHQWPGNIRELKNNLEYTFAVGDGPHIKLSELMPELSGKAPPNSFSQKNHEIQAMKQALKDSGGRKAQAAKTMGLSRTTFWRKLRELQLSGTL